MKLVKVFPGKGGRVKKRERHQCTDPTCNHEETIQPANEERAVRIDAEYREQFRKEKEHARAIQE